MRRFYIQLDPPTYSPVKMGVGVGFNVSAQPNSAQPNRAQPDNA